MALWSKTYMVKCPDGTIRIVYKDADKAIPLSFRNTDSKAKVDVEGLGGATAARTSKIQSVLISLSEKNESLVLNYRVAYLAYMSNPCQGYDRYQELVGNLALEQGQLTKAQMLVSTLTELATRGTDGTEKFAETFSQIVDLIGLDRYTAPPASKMAIAESRAVAREWIHRTHAEPSDDNAQNSVDGLEQPEVDR
jgi:hypothetical protein